jgi:hypothetical protein
MSSGDLIVETDVRDVLCYRPDTGEFRWTYDCKKHRSGDLAGTKNRAGYLCIRIGDKLYYAHRLAFLVMTGSFPSRVVNHADGNKANNAWNNLREATRSQSNGSRRRTSASSGLKGAYFSKQIGRWYSRIGADGKDTFLGTFDTKEDAHAAYREHAAKLFKEFSPF